MGGYFRISRENPDFWAFLVDSWGKIICDPRYSSIMTIVYSDSKLSPIGIQSGGNGYSNFLSRVRNVKKLVSHGEYLNIEFFTEYVYKNQAKTDQFYGSRRK